MEFEITHKLGSELSPVEIDDILEIFHADQKHESDERKAIFEDRWMGPYLVEDPGNSIFYVAKNNEGKVLSYLVGHANSSSLISNFADRVRAYAVFSDLFERFPVHLHINNHPNSRGHGLGSRVMTAFLEDLRRQGFKGVHLVTTPSARNVSFYESNGFKFKETRTLDKKTEILFLGQRLQD